MNNNTAKKLPTKALASSMRNIEDILMDVAVGNEINKDEERLVDLLAFEKTGKRFGRFKNTGTDNKLKPDTTGIVLTAANTPGHHSQLQRPFKRTAIGVEGLVTAPGVMLEGTL